MLGLDENMSFCGKKGQFISVIGTVDANDFLGIKIRNQEILL